MPLYSLIRTSGEIRGQSEDCLFLDIYVPKEAFSTGAAPLLVVTWFFGGGFSFRDNWSLGPKLPV